MNFYIMNTVFYIKKYDKLFSRALRYLFHTNKSLTHDYIQIITQVLMLERKCKLHTKNLLEGGDNNQTKLLSIVLQTTVHTVHYLSR